MGYLRASKSPIQEYLTKQSSMENRQKMMEEKLNGFYFEIGYFESTSKLFMIYSILKSGLCLSSLKYHTGRLFLHHTSMIQKSKKKIF